MDDLVALIDAAEGEPKSVAPIKPRQMRVDCGQLDPGMVIQPVAPAYARASRRRELADWRAGRNAVYQLAALTIGARLVVSRTHKPSLKEQLSRSRATCSSTARPLMSSGRAPYFFFHFARKLGWPNISASRTRAVLAIMDWQRIASTAGASTAMSIKTSSLLRVTCVTRAQRRRPRMIEASVPTHLVGDALSSADRLPG
jgi:hypothetical protein